MRRLHDMIPTISRKVIDRIGAECLYTSASGQKTVSAYIDLNVMDVGEYGQYTGTHIEIEFLKADIDPKRGDTAEIDGVTYYIEGKVISEESNNSTIRVTAYAG